MKGSKQAKRNLDRLLDNMVGDTWDKVPGVGGIIYREGEPVYSHFVGHRTLAVNGQKKLPLTENSRFRIASLSKMFTIFTLLELWEQGKIDLNADVSRYLGFTLRHPHYPQIPITARLLACHLSSLRDGRVYSISPEKSLSEFFSPQGEYWENGAHFAPAGEPPGEFFTYANLNYGLLGTIIEAVTGERFDRYQKGHILRELETGADYVPGNFSPREFRKLGTTYQKKDAEGRWDERGAWQGKADAYTKEPPRETLVLQNPYAEKAQDSHRLKNYRPGKNATIFSPTGGLRISARELAHALEMLINGGIFRGRQILSPTAVELMCKNHWVYDPEKNNGNTYGGTLLAYGLGLYPMRGGSSAALCHRHNINLVGHTGEAFGLLSALCFRPGTKDGFVYVINGTAIDPEQDPRSHGRFSHNYLWEEKVADAFGEFWGGICATIAGTHCLKS